MIQLRVMIYKVSNINWVLQVTTPGNPQVGRSYSFQKDGFANFQDAKNFFAKNAAMFVVQMGEP